MDCFNALDSVVLLRITEVFKGVDEEQRRSGRTSQLIHQRQQRLAGHWCLECKATHKNLVLGLFTTAETKYSLSKMMILY